MNAQPAAARWEHFEHDADVGVRGYGRTLDEAFEQAALAMTAIITEPGCVRDADEVPIRCRASGDDELLLVDWLNAVIYEMAVRRMLFRRFEVEIDEAGLRGRAWGEAVDVARHSPAVEVKGATLTCLSVGREPDGAWRAQCIVDV